MRTFIFSRVERRMDTRERAENTENFSAAGAAQLNFLINLRILFFFQRQVHPILSMEEPRAQYSGKRPSLDDVDVVSRSARCLYFDSV